MSQDKIKVILDTDIGDDIDDAFALLLMVESNAFDVLGVTTVFRNAYKRAKMASYLLKNLNKNIDVYAGLDNPLVAKIENIVQKEIRDKETLDEDGKYHLPQYIDKMDMSKVNDKNAVDFIIEQIHKYPYEVVIISIGPLTNIATAFTKDPSIIPLIKEVRIMGGGLDLNFSEWNIWCDPEAAHIVFNSGVNLSSVGLNVTSQTALNKDFIEQMKSSKAKPVLLIYDMMMKWFKHYEFTSPVMHDPLTVASFIDSNILTFKEEHINISLDKQSYGRFVADKNQRNIDKYAITVDKDRFFKLLNEVVFKNKIQ